ncbi:MAG: DUF484 family protein [Pseudomonadota bacterium]
MTTSAKALDDLRQKILSEPGMILEDADVMRALVDANEKAMGHNVVDLRSVAMHRLEARLARLEDMHKSVIAAAYENLAGTNQVQRAVLRLLDAVTFEQFLVDLAGDVADILRVDSVRLVLESKQDPSKRMLQKVSDVLSVAEPGFVDDYITYGREIPVRQVTLRQIHPDSGGLYGQAQGFIQSEACLKLDIGPSRLPAMLALGSEDPHLFASNQGTDLLTFFSGVFEKTMRRWLA